eukprot:1618243-Heterocapsa_arctica.AAC.1
MKQISRGGQTPTKRRNSIEEDKKQRNNTIHREAKLKQHLRGRQSRRTRVRMRKKKRMYRGG